MQCSDYYVNYGVPQQIHKVCDPFLGLQSQLLRYGRDIYLIWARKTRIHPTYLDLV